MKIKPKMYYASNQKLFSEEQFLNHLVLYSGYVERTNNNNTDSLSINGVILHELFFENISNIDENDNKPIIEEFFKGYPIDFFPLAQAAKGWVIFGYNPLTQTFHNIILNTHDEWFIIGFKPLLVLDCYEHSYWMDYGANKNQYIKDFIKNINWKVVQERIDKK